MIFLKVGGSVITDKSKPFQMDWTGVNTVVQDIGGLDEELVLGHGGGSFGHYVASEYAGRPEGFFKIKEAMAKLNMLFVSSLVSKGVDAVGFPPSAFMLCKGGDVEEMLWEPVAEAAKRYVPVVHGDAVLDLEDLYTILSTERVLRELAAHVKPRRVLLATDGPVMVDGDAVDEVTDGNFEEVYGQLGGAQGIDVTGGMKAKVLEAARLSAEQKVEVYIFDGSAPGAIKRAWKHGEGTRVRVSRVPSAGE